MPSTNPMLAPARSFDLETADFTGAQEYTRTALVYAIPGTPGENTMIIIADHEHRTIPEATFAEAFEPTTTRGYYRARESVRAISNPISGSIRVEALRGGFQYGGASCMIVLSGDRRYLMERGTFNATFNAI